MSDYKRMMIRLKNKDRDLKKAKEDREARLIKRLNKLLGTSFETSAEYVQRRQDELDYDYENTPIEKKQLFLDLMHQGLNLGQAREKAGISLDVASQVILRNSTEHFPTKVTK
jgi:hypothetical protein